MRTGPQQKTSAPFRLPAKDVAQNKTKRHHGEPRNDRISDDDQRIGETSPG